MRVLPVRFCKDTEYGGLRFDILEEQRIYLAGSSPMEFILLIFVLTVSIGVHCQRPAVVNIGAVLTYNSAIGEVAKDTINLAVDDINEDSSVLGGTKLNLLMENSNCSVLIGSLKALQLLDKGVVAIIGPQASPTAHMMSFIATGFQVPLISFAATDPTLSALQFPYFLRATFSDAHQMVAMASLLDYYDWKEIVVIFVDDDYGRNGVSFLENELAEKRKRFHFKIGLPVGASRNQILNVLRKYYPTEPRVFIVHANPDTGLMIFEVAQQLNMMVKNYVWFASDWLAAALDLSRSYDKAILDSLEGVVGFCQHVPASDKMNNFLIRWKEKRRKAMVKHGLNAYGLFAYDAVWIVAIGINEYLNDGRNISFSLNTKLNETVKSAIQLERLKVFDGGPILLDHLRKIDFDGLTGRLQFDSERNLINSSYTIVNINNRTFQTIGYWSNYSGLSTEPPEVLREKSVSFISQNQRLGNVVWPGGNMEKPRGWEIANDNKPLRIGVPRRTSFTEFVTENNDTHKVEGYSIDVFEAALKHISYNIPHKFVPFGDGLINPSYDELVRLVSEDVFDGAVGDITIVTNRTKIVDFTQPYTATGLVVVLPVKTTKSNAWVFLQPFSVGLWCATAGSFFLIGGVIWLLEHRVNDHFRGPPKRQLITTILFSFSTLFNTQQESTLSALGKMVMMVWLFLLLVITSSYTASLTSILTVRQLSSTITDMDSLIASKGRIGYQVGSFAYGYLKDSYNIPASRLVSLKNPQEFVKALRLGTASGGVAAVVDELPYVELFLKKQSDFKIIGQMFTKSGWGFAFQRDSPLVIDLSSAILKLSETDELKKIHDNWLCKEKCATQRGYSLKPDQLHLKCFQGLFIFCGFATFAAVVVFLHRAIRQYVRYQREQRFSSSNLVSTSVSTSEASWSKALISFFDFVDEKEEAVKNFFRRQEGTPNAQG